MRLRVAFAVSCLALLLCAAPLTTQSWTLKDTGVGLVVMDGEYASKLEPLYAAGAFSGRSDTR